MPSDVIPQTVNMHDAKTNLSRLVEDVERTGVEVVIARSGKPVARLVPYDRQPAYHRRPGLLAADPAWRDWRFDPAVFAPMTEAEAEAEGW